jgi:hypothetical protein
MLKCSCSAVEEKKIDEITIELFCPIHGTSYLYLTDHGQIETAAVRMKRMERHFVCEQCHTEHYDYFQFQNKERKICDKCLKYNMHRDRDHTGIKKEWVARDNSGSPWRMRQGKIKKEIVPSCR